MAAEDCMRRYRGGLGGRKGGGGKDHGKGEREWKIIEMFQEARVVAAFLIKSSDSGRGRNQRT